MKEVIVSARIKACSGRRLERADARALIGYREAVLGCPTASTSGPPRAPCTKRRRGRFSRGLVRILAGGSGEERTDSSRARSHQMSPAGCASPVWPADSGRIAWARALAPAHGSGTILLCQLGRGDLCELFCSFARIGSRPSRGVGAFFKRSTDRRGHFQRARRGRRVADGLSQRRRSTGSVLRRAASSLAHRLARRP